MNKLINRLWWRFYWWCAYKIDWKYFRGLRLLTDKIYRDEVNDIPF